MPAEHDESGAGHRLRPEPRAGQGVASEHHGDGRRHHADLVGQRPVRVGGHRRGLGGIHEQRGLPEPVSGGARARQHDQDSHPCGRRPRQGQLVAPSPQGDQDDTQKQRGSSERRLHRGRVPHQTPRRRGDQVLPAVRDGGEIGAGEFAGHREADLAHLLQGGAAEVLTVVDGAVIVSAARDDGGVVGVEAGLREMCDVGGVGQGLERGLRGGLRDGTGRLGQHLQERFVRGGGAEHRGRTPRPPGLVVEHDGGTQG